MRRFNCQVLAAIIAFGCVAMSSSLRAGETDSAGTDGTVPGPLDGMTFVGMLGPDGKPKDTADTFVFENGTFVSKECELRCQYPARPYFVREDGDKTLFISETKCPHKDAKITWRGTVDGDTIRGKSTWTVRRWYWTFESTFEYEGKLVSAPTDTASNE